MLIVLLLAAVTSFGQILTGNLTITVTDSTDAVVPNAVLTVKDLESGKVYTDKTDATGSFTFTSLPNGVYSVTVEQPGFAKALVERVQVFVSQSSKIGIRLEIAKTGTEVVVEAQQTGVQTESVELKNTVESKQLNDMPLPTRNPLDLVKTFAGVLTSNSASGATGGDAFVHGLRGNVTNLTQDGINVQDNTVKTSAFFALSAPITDQIGEFNLSVGGVGADAGFGAAQVSMVTNRGSNTYHGTAFWFERTSYLNANTWFNNQAGTPRPFQLQNRLGGTFGGPASIPKLYNAKNRTFLFFSYEAYREPRAQPRTRTVMTPSAEQGLFTYTPTTGGAPLTVNLLNLGTIGNTGQKPQINSTIMPFYQKIVPQSGYTDAGCANGDGVNFRCLSFNLGGVNNADRYAMRVDHQLTSKHSLEFVWTQEDPVTTPDLLNGIEPLFTNSPFSGGQVSRRQVFVWALQSVLTPTTTNEFRVGYTRAPVQFAYGYNFSDTGGNQVAFPSQLTSPVLTSTNLPQGRNTPLRQIFDNYAWVKGTHQIRLGGEWRWVLSTGFFNSLVIPRTVLGTNSANPDGLSANSFAGGISATALTKAQQEFDTITGMLSTVSQAFNHTSATSGYVPGVPEQYTPSMQNFAFYLQDSWKIRRNLTFQYGMRWEYQGPYDSRDGLVVLPQNGLQSIYGPTPIGGLFQPGNTNGATDVSLTLQGKTNGHPFTKRDLNNFAPFGGIAWDPKGDGKTSIRASFATHYAADGLTFWENATTQNPGLFTTAANSVPTGVFSPTSQQLPASPPSVFPVSAANTFNNVSNGTSLLSYDPNLATPYVLEWSLGVQHELPKKYTIEARYVGNHAVKQYRTWSVNELDLQNNGLLTEFQHAQTNLAINTANKVTSFANTGLPGEIATPIFDKLFAGLPATSGYTNSTFITNLNQNVIGTMYDTIRRSSTYRNNAQSQFPLNFFVANPWSNSAFWVNNAGWSGFHGLEVEVKRRFSSGFFMQANYTFSKVLADTTFGESQSENQNYQSLSNTGLDKFRSGINVTHSFGMTFLYPIPVGRGKQFGGNMPVILDKVLGGWNINGFTHWSTGGPFSISSRVTTGSLVTSTASVRNMTANQLQENIGVYRGPNGVYWLNPNSGLLNINKNSSSPVICTAGQTTPCFYVPAAGDLGNTSFNQFTGPHFFDQDLSLVKDTKIFERLTFQIRLEAFDLFNNANFSGPSSAAGGPANIDGSAFGQLTSTFDTARGGGVTSRIVQWAAKFIF